MTGRNVPELQTAAFPSRWVGREDSSVFGANQREEIRWIGKPWRRVELLTNRVFDKGEQIDVTRDLTFHIGFRRLGIGLTFSIVRASYLSYDEDRL